MDMKLSDAEAKLQSDLRAWLEAHYDFDAVLARTGSAQSRDAAIWQGLVDGGWIARALPRREDLQQSAIDASIVAEEFGRALVIEPFFRSNFLAANLLLEALPASEGDKAIAAIGQGEHRYACAFYEADGRFWLDQVETRADRQSGWRITGRKAMVLDGADADRILLTARTAEGSIGLFEIAGDAAGLKRTRFHTIDDFAAADITLEGVEAHALVLADDAIAMVQSAVDRTITALGAESVGAASAAIDETAAYTGKRVQFGRPLSGFQVVAHRLARMFTELEGLRGGVIEALSNAAESAGDRAQAAAGLKFLIGENGRFVVNQGVQLHGGNGTIHEYKISHCFKRVFATDILFGNGDFHLERYARAMS
jgi:alkylation response protein AidB-like acyl-CoA dehydrogenase